MWSVRYQNGGSVWFACAIGERLGKGEESAVHGRRIERQKRRGIEGNIWVITKKGVWEVGKGRGERTSRRGGDERRSQDHQDDQACMVEG